MFQVSPIIGIMVATGVLFVGLPDRLCNENQSKTRENTNPSQMGSTKVLEGVWGGENIIMEVTADSAVITCDCAVGTIDEPMKLDKDGRFKVQGTFTRQQGGSVRSDQVRERHPVHYVGRIEGKSMTLILKLPKTNETVDTFYLTYGETPELKRCM